jgi:hypothetical protein
MWRQLLVSRELTRSRMSCRAAPRKRRGTSHLQIALAPNIRRHLTQTSVAARKRLTACEVPRRLRGSG